MAQLIYRFCVKEYTKGLLQNNQVNSETDPSRLALRSSLLNRFLGQASALLCALPNKRLKLRINRFILQQVLSSVKLQFAIVLLLIGCGGSKADRPVSSLASLCQDGSHFNGRTCVQQSSARKLVTEAQAALVEFDVDKALPLLEKALAMGPHDHELLIDIYKERGIAFSYLEKEEETLASFEMLLTLDPGHLLNYTLSPKTTFLFERARKKNSGVEKTAVALSWPQNRKVDEDVPVTVEVIADPAKMLNKMALFVRYDEKSSYKRISLDLAGDSSFKRIRLPAADMQRATTLQFYGSVYNQSGDEVLLWFSPKQPREISLAYQKPLPWYRKWWVWTIAGGSLAAVTGVTVYALSLEPSDTVPGGFGITR